MVYMCCVVHDTKIGRDNLKQNFTCSKFLAISMPLTSQPFRLPQTVEALAPGGHFLLFDTKKGHLPPARKASKA